MEPFQTGPVRAFDWDFWRLVLILDYLSLRIFGVAARAKIVWS